MVLHLELRESIDERNWGQMSLTANVGGRSSIWKAPARIAASFRIHPEVRPVSRFAASPRSSQRRIPAVPIILTLAMVVALVWQSATPQRAITRLNHAALTSSSGSWAPQQSEFATSGTSCPSTTQCFAVGTTFAGAAFAAGQGNAWGSPTLVPSFTSISAVSCPTTSVCFVVGQASPSSMLIDETVNGGSSWLPPLAATSMRGLSTVSCTSTSVCAVGGTIPDGSFADGAVAQLTSSGSVLSLATPLKLEWSYSVVGLSCTATGYCAAIDTLSQSSTNFWYSTDSGATWTGGTPMPNGNTQYFAGISCQPGSGSVTCVAVGTCVGGNPGCPQGEIAWTNNSGMSWTSLTLPSTPIVRSLASVACASTSQCTVVGQQGFECYLVVRR